MSSRSCGVCWNANGTSAVTGLPTAGSKRRPTRGPAGMMRSSGMSGSLLLPCHPKHDVVVRHQRLAIVAVHDVAVLDVVNPVGPVPRKLQPLGNLHGDISALAKTRARRDR